MTGGSKTFTVREATPSDRPAILAIAEDLPEWFDEHARQVAIPTDIVHQHVSVALEGPLVVGFISLYVSDGRLNIGWIGVLKSHHRKGIGHQLLRTAEERARAMGVAEIAVSTLGDAVEYAPYDQTRSFYRKNGFVAYQRSKTDNPGCPEELKLRKQL